MTLTSPERKLSPKSLRTYGVARAQDLAFDAVLDLWQRRRSAGMKQKDLAEHLGRDRGWVSKALKGPGNWTFRTFGELVAAMDGEIEIRVHGLEDAPTIPNNYDAYAEFYANDTPASPMPVASVLDVVNQAAANPDFESPWSGQYDRQDWPNQDKSLAREEATPWK
jgi:hypothetical protein